MKLLAHTLSLSLILFHVGYVECQLLTLATYINNSWLNELDGDIEEETYFPNKKPRNVNSGHFVRVKPTPLPNPHLVSYSDKFIHETLGLSVKETVEGKDFTHIFSGHIVKEGMFTDTWCSPYALSIYGHEHIPDGAGTDGYGYGDGRAVSLGEVLIDNDNLTESENKQRNSGTVRYEFQMKGAGMTPFSRGGDGKSVLRSSVREFLVSEAMFHLNVPTTRAMSLIASTTEVIGRPWYTKNDDENSNDSSGDDGYVNKHGGNVMNDEATAITTRAAHSFIRIGTFELYSRRLMKPNQSNSVKQLALTQLAKLFIHTLNRECGFSSLQLDGSSSSTTTTTTTTASVSSSEDIITPSLIVNFAEMTAVRLSYLASSWIRVGYTQSNWNSDNCHIAGITLDYGPFGFIEKYHPKFVMWVGGGEHYSFMNQINASHQNYKSLLKALKPFLLDVKHLRNKKDRQNRSNKNKDDEDMLIKNVCSGTSKMKLKAINSLRQLEDNKYEILSKLEFNVMLASKLGLLNETPKMPQLEVEVEVNSSGDHCVSVDDIDNDSVRSKKKRKNKHNQQKSSNENSGDENKYLMNVVKGNIYNNRVAYLKQLWTKSVNRKIATSDVNDRNTKKKKKKYDDGLESVVDLLWSSLEPLLIEMGADWTIFWRQLAYIAQWLMERRNDDNLNSRDNDIVNAPHNRALNINDVSMQIYDIISISFSKEPIQSTKPISIFNMKNNEVEEDESILKIKNKWLLWIKQWFEIIQPLHGDIDYIKVMLNSSPRYIPREWMLVKAYEEAEEYFKFIRQHSIINRRHSVLETYDDSVLNNVTGRKGGKKNGDGFFDELERLKLLFTSPYKEMFQDDKYASNGDSDNDFTSSSVYPSIQQDDYYRLPPRGSDKQGGVGFMS